MAQILQGKDVINVLNKLKNPASINEIVEYMLPNNKESKTKLNKAVQTSLEAAVNYGFVKKVNDDKYQAEDFVTNNEENNKSDEDAKIYEDKEDETDSQQDDNASAAPKSGKNVTKTAAAKKKHKIIFKPKYEYSTSEDDDENIPNSYDLLDPEDAHGRRGRSRSRSRRRRSRSGRRRSRRRRR